MSKDKLNDENFGTRDKRGFWKPFANLTNLLTPSKLTLLSTNLSPTLTLASNALSVINFGP